MTSTKRQTSIQCFSQEDFDVLILGGGINGAVAAASLSAKGAKVALIDKGDFASFSSSNSSNLAWGGIKYLESGEFWLVSKLCRSRNHLMEHYPSQVKEIRFFTTINKGFRWPAWFIYLGSLFYWLMGLGKTRLPRYLSRQDIGREEPVINSDNSVGGVEYSDCYLPGNDARFVFSFIRAAIGNNAAVANYVEALGSVRQPTGAGHWSTEIRDNLTGQRLAIKSKAIINACGAYVDDYNHLIGQVTEHRHVFSKGVHLIVRRLTPHEKILAFFASDGRLFFVIPMGDQTCIGTTDTPVKQADTPIGDDDRQFILDNANSLLKLEKPLTKQDIIAERCGVRPLAVKRGKNSSADWLKLSRKHAIHTNHAVAYISVFGGKITDCLNVGNELAEICGQLRIVKSAVNAEDQDQKWYGEPEPAEKSRFLKTASELDLEKMSLIFQAQDSTPTESIGQQKDLESEQQAAKNQDEVAALEPIAERWWRRFGVQAYQLIEQVKLEPKAIRRPISRLDYCACEIALMGREEMIVNLDDFLRRRSKIAMTMHTDELLAHPGLQEISALLFGEEQAQEKLKEYRQLVGGEALQSPPVKAIGA